MGYQDGRRYGEQDRSRSDWDRGSNRYRGQRDWQDDRQSRYGTRGQFGGPDYRRGREDYDPDDRGFFDRAGDEVRSWFGDEEAERRREYDEYYNRPYGDPRDESSRMGYASAGRSRQYLPNRGYAPFAGERSGYGSEDHGNRIRSFGPSQDYGEHHDANYHAWRKQRIDELDRDYSEYQREHRERFNQEFGSWRTKRGEQRQAVQQVREHMEVVGSDGEHVGTVDKLSGDRIILTKTDEDADGMHHSIPSSWIRSVDAQKVTIEKTADEAHTAWRTERDQNAMFGNQDDRGGWGAQGSGSGNPQGQTSRYR